MATWISIAVIAWVAVSVVVALAVGRMVRVADSRQPMHPTRDWVRTLRPQPAAPAAAAVEPLRRVS